jgi:hypothetical protein
MSSSISLGPAYSAGGGAGGGSWLAGRPDVIVILGRSLDGAASADVASVSGNGSPDRKAWRNLAKVITSASGGPLASPSLPSEIVTGKYQLRLPCFSSLVVFETGRGRSL